MGVSNVRHLPCGDFVNASEQLAVERVRAKLEGAGGYWILLSNLNHSQHPGLRSDEIDLVVIGPNGVHVIEVKHWDVAYLRQQQIVVEQEAERINSKAKRIAGKLRQKSCALSERRNALIHEALYGGQPVGFAHPAGHEGMELELTRLVARLLLRLLGIENEYTRSDCTTRSTIGFRFNAK